MDTTPLDTLEGRWPGDQSIFSSSLDALRNVADNLQIDEHDSQIIAQFASANHFTYEQRPSHPPARTSGYTPAWIRTPTPLNEPAFVHEVQGTINGYPFTMCLEYVPASAGDGNSKIQSLAKRGIIRVRLPKVFPQLVLDSNKNDRGLTSTLPDSIKATQAITLEGDFANYFDFFTPVGLQVNALTVLAPNFMQILKDSSASFDVEFYGPEMILVTREPIYTPEIMEQAFRALQTQLAYLSNLLVSWNYHPTKQSFDTLEYSTFNGDVVKIGSVRLKPGALIILILLGLGLLGAVAALANRVHP